MENENGYEVIAGSMEELKELIRALPDDMVLSVSFGEGGEDGENKMVPIERTEPRQ